MPLGDSSPNDGVWATGFSLSVLSIRSNPSGIPDRMQTREDYTDRGQPFVFLAMSHKWVQESTSTSMGLCTKLLRAFVELLASADSNTMDTKDRKVWEYFAWNFRFQQDRNQWWIYQHRVHSFSRLKTIVSAVTVRQSESVLVSAKGSAECLAMSTVYVTLDQGSDTGHGNGPLTYACFIYSKGDEASLFKAYSGQKFSHYLVETAEHTEAHDQVQNTITRS